MLFICILSLFIFPAVSTSDYSWTFFALPTVIGGSTVFLCVCLVVTFRIVHFRSRASKRTSGKHTKSHNSNDGQESLPRSKHDVSRATNVTGSEEVVELEPKCSAFHFPTDDKGP